MDGGANFVMDQLGRAKPQWPDIVTGDFDSIRSDVLTFCKEKVSFYSKSSHETILHHHSTESVDYHIDYHSVVNLPGAFVLC